MFSIICITTLGTTDEKPLDVSCVGLTNTRQTALDAIGYVFDEIHGPGCKVIERDDRVGCMKPDGSPDFETIYVVNETALIEG